jgi:hypothetical protein
MTATMAATIIMAANGVFLVAVCALVSEGPAVNVVLYVNALLGVIDAQRFFPERQEIKASTHNWRNRSHQRAPQQRDRL